MNATAFERALADRKAILADRRVQSTSLALRIVGPAFTGGASALADAVVRAKGAGRLGRDERVNIISGSVTGPVKQLLEQSDSNVTYHSTVHSDDVLERVERNVLCSLLQIPVRRIAILRESSTQYGALLADGRNAVPAPADTGKCNESFLEIPFPANISSLRSEYARAPQSQALEPRDGRPAQRISLNLQDPSRAMEHPPVTSALTPAMLDVMLEEIARTLEAYRIRAVGILATDTRDKLFLAEQLRQRRRELMLFTTSSNVLLLRKDVNAALRGMLVFSTYPLQVGVQRWDNYGVGHRRLLFASSEAEGVFNAARLQLENGPWLAEYGVRGQRDADYYCEPGYRKFTTNAPDVIPPVWVLAIGRSGYFPITACPTGNGNDLMLTRQSSLERSPTLVNASTHTIIGVLLVTFVALFAMLENRQRKFLWRKVPRMYGDKVVRDVDWRLLILHANLYGALRAFAVAVIISGLAIGFAHRLGDELWESPEIQSATVIAAVTIALLAGTRLVNGWKAGREAWTSLGYDHKDAQPYCADHRERRSRRADYIGRIVIFLVCVAYLVCVVIFLYQVHRLGNISPLRADLFLERAGELSGGYSPAMVLALTGAMFALWSSWHISRIQMLLSWPSAFERASFESRAGIPDHDTIPRVARWSAAMRAARSHLMILTPDTASTALFIVCLVLSMALARIIAPTLEVLLFTRYKFLLTSDNGERLVVSMFDVLVRFGVTASLSATAWSVYRTGRVWVALQRTLDELGRMPRMTAFERLPRRIARLTRLNVIRPQAEKLVRSISSTQWTHLRRLYAGMSDAERASLTAGMPTVRIGDTTRELAPQYLDQLMTAEAVWPRDDWMSPKPPIPPRSIESAALRFLFDVTDHAQLDEPSISDLAHVGERTEIYSEEAPRSTSGNIRRTFAGPMRLWVRTAEEFIAVQAVDYIYRIMQHIRLLTLYIIGALAIVTELIWSYQLHPSSALWLIVIMLVISAMAVLVTVAVQMNRNEVISRINGTTPGVVTWDWQFVMNLVLIAIVPAITFVGSELPWLRDGLSTWFNPIIRAAGGH